MNILKEGRAWKFGDNISTDLIQPGRYFHLKSNLPELAKHTLEDAELKGTDKNFAEVVTKGDYIVGGDNFGLGSSREHAPAIIQISGVRAILAKSFARIFFRNAINLGLPVIECNIEKVGNGDRLKINLNECFVLNLSRKIKIHFDPLPDMVLNILRDGGLITHIKKYDGFNLRSQQ